MNNFLPCSVLKKRAKEQLFMNLGTVIGAFLVHMLCLLPIALVVGEVIPNNLIKVFFYLVASIALEVYGAFFTVGESLIYLKLATGSEVGVMDLFYGFKGSMSKILGLAIIPAVVLSVVEIPVILLNNVLMQVMPSNEEMLKMLQSNDIQQLYDISMKTLPINLLNLGASVLYLIIMVIVTIAFSQVYFIMLDYPEMNAMEIIKYGFKIMKGSWGRYLYMMLSFIPWYILMFLTCGISYLFTYPYMRATKANFYMDLVNKQEGRK